LVAYAAIATDLYLPAIPAMIRDLGATEADGQLTLSIFMVGLAVGQLIFGPLSDQFGRLPVVRAGTFLFLTTSVLCAMARDMELMWLMRALQGVAAASGPVIARAIVRDRYHGNRASQVMSTLSGAMAVIPMVAPSIGALILTAFSWPAVFVALAVFALLILLALTRLPESAPPPETERLTVTKVLQSFSLMLSNPTYLGYQIAGSFSFAALFCYLSTVAYFLPDVFNIPTHLFGYAFALTVFGFMTGSLVNAKIVMRYGMDQTLRAGLLVSLASAACIAGNGPLCQRVRVYAGHAVLTIFPWCRPHRRQCLYGSHFVIPTARRLRVCRIWLHPCAARIGRRSRSRQALRRTTTGACADYAGLRGAGPIGLTTHATPYSPGPTRNRQRFALSHHYTPHAITGMVNMSLREKPVTALLTTPETTA
jgi:Bcr/CflA subfamily drug resistance transporter